jgi:hypothetical protein
MPIAKLMAEHCRVLELAGVLEKIAAGPRPETSGLFMLARWNFTREVLSHLSRDEALVILPLMGDRRPHIAQLATQSREQLRMLGDDVENHMGRWIGLPGATEWPQYRREVQALIRRLRASIAAEESGIYHFLPAQQPERRPAPAMGRPHAA